MQVKGGASSHEFEIRADEYEENRHYFIAQYFRDNYNNAMATLPVVAVPCSRQLPTSPFIRMMEMP